MPISFDDLIPADNQNNAVSFDDLIPQTTSQPEQEQGWGDWFAGLGQQAAQRGLGFSQNADDLARLGANGATFGFADKIVAGLSPSTVEQERAATQAARDRQGWLGTGAEIAGGVAVPFGMAQRGASLLGRFGTGAMTGLGGVAARTGLAGVEGAGYGVVDALGNDRSLAGGAAIGAAGGAAGNILGEGVGAVANAMRSPIDKAREYVAQRAAYDRLTPQAATTRLDQLGQSGVLADLGVNLQNSAGAVASVPGEGQSIVTQALRGRNEGSNARLRGELDQTLGAAPVPSAIDTQLRTAQQDLAPEYGRVLSGARAVDTQNLAAKLDANVVNLRGAAQRATQNVRKMLNVTGTDILDPSPATLLQTRQAIDGLLSKETDTNAIRALTQARQEVDDVLTQSVPDIKNVDARYQELALQREAVGEGQQLLDSGRTSLRPQELSERMTSAAVPSGQFMGPSAVPVRLREGARAEIDRIVGTNSNDRAALQRIIKGDGDWNRDRLVTLFGRDKTDRLLSVLDAETAMQNTFNTALGNSVTAARAAAQADLPGNKTADNIVTSLLDLRGGDAARKLLGSAFGGTMRSRDDAAKAEIARLLMSRDVNALRPVVPNTGVRDSIVRALIGASGYAQ